ncbi:MAG: hypothetical protein QF496_01345 [Dehalococcoidia bacterium]|jgi:hypothetical protein|nr:hypothetical protein [Dehalococcoidia bacterium]
MKILIFIFTTLLLISAGLLFYQSLLENNLKDQLSENRHTNNSYIKIMNEVEKGLFD